MTAPNLGFSLLSVNQASKETTINEAFATIDTVAMNGVTTKSLTVAPSSPASGTLYIVGASATGEWAGYDNYLAYYYNGWKFIAPKEGAFFWVDDESEIYIYTGSAWTLFTASFTSSSVAQLGVNATADSTNKLSVNSNSVLFNHNGNGMTAYINKAASTDTNSLIFETGFSARAQFGCAGSDNFTVKVSPDGSTFYTAMTASKTDGTTTFGTDSTFSGTLKSTGMVHFPSPTTLSVSSNSIAVTQSYHTVTGTGSTAEIIYTITGGAAGMILYLTSSYTSHNITVSMGHGGTNSITGANNVILTGAATGNCWCGIFDGTYWRTI